MLVKILLVSSVFYGILDCHMLQFFSLDIVFEIGVYPYLVNVFETFNGGSVRRLWAGDGEGYWKLLSEKPKQRSLKYSFIYAPKLGNVNFLTR